MQLILILCGLVLAKTDSCGTDGHPCYCCENGLTDCIFPFPDACTTLAVSEQSELPSFFGCVMKSLSSTISTIRFETLSDLDTHMKFLMKIPLLTDSMIESIEDKILESSRLAARQVITCDHGPEIKTCQFVLDVSHLLVLNSILR